MNIIRSIAFILSFVLLSLFLHTCASTRVKTVEASKNIITKDYETTNFHTLELTGGYNIEYRQNYEGEAKVSIQGADNLIELLDVRVARGVLKIEFPANMNIKGSHKIVVYASSPHLAKASITGSGNINIGKLRSFGKLQLGVSGSGDIDISSAEYSIIEAAVTGSGQIYTENILAEMVAAKITGSGFISLSGTSDEADYLVTGSGNIEARDLVCSEVTAKITGSGNIKCHALEVLMATVTGSGKIKYDGSPKNIKTNDQHIVPLRN